MITGKQGAREPIAIVGIGCRFPGGVRNPETFWDLLKDGVDAISEVPQDRWNLEKYYDSNRAKPGKAYTRWGGFLDQIDQFDAQFFGISPREASMLDPQQRLLLEVCWEALEDGGQIPEQLRGSKTGVFIGGFTLDYKYLQFTESNRDVVDSHTATGAMMTLLANRLSYVYDFQGPSLAVDTACSSSLVAVHLACQSLWNDESTLAVAGGVNVMLKPDITIAESKAGMMSPDGRSKAFDSRANGYVRGEGAGVVILKPLSQAQADGDPIYALIRGTAANQDGNSSGLTVPRGESQQALLREACERAGVSPKDLQYVEAHGTGTPVGDPIEANALGSVLAEGRPDGEFCYVGSVKTNFGHTEAAAGVAGLIKAALSLKHGYIPKHLHLITPNPKIDFDRLQLKVPQELTAWPQTAGPRLAGVNSFGFGGTNAHAILQEAPAQPAFTPQEERLTVFPISARSQEALQAQADSWLQELETEGPLQQASLPDIAYTASRRRSQHAHRLAVVAKSKEELADSLRAFLADETRPGLSFGQAGTGKQPLVFVYTGMGPQWWGMGQQLYREEPVFRQALDQCDALFQKVAGWSLLDEMLKDESNSRMAETEVAQPANFFLQVGLTELWRSYGLVPDAIVGHSAGEAASAYAAGAMSLAEAVRVIYHRSRLQQKTTGLGKLVAVSLSPDEVKGYLQGFEDRISIAAINSPTAVTLVGDPDALEQVVSPMQEQGIFCKYLYVKVPYHSHYMEPLKAELLEVLHDLELQETTLPLYSTVSGKLIQGTELGAMYWWHNVRDSVYFADATKNMLSDGYRVFVEVGPHPVLASSINECLAVANKQGVVVPSMRRGQDEQLILQGALGALFVQGFDVTWSTVHPCGEIVRLPKYMWQRERYWNESAQSRKDRIGEKLRPLLGARMHTPTPGWETEINLSQLPYIRDHLIQSAVVFPGAAYYEMVCEGITELFGCKSEIAYEVVNGEFHKALFVPEDKNIKLQLTIDPQTGAYRIYDASDKNETNWALHASGNLVLNSRFTCPQVSIADLQAEITCAVSKEDCYLHFRQLGLEYGPTFQGINQLWQSEDQALAKVVVPEAVAAEMSNYEIHPAIFDLVFQTLAAALPFSGQQTVYMPTGAERTLYRGALNANEIWIHAKIREKNNTELIGDIRLFDEQGNTVFEIINCRARSLKDDSQTLIGSVPLTYSELLWTGQDLLETTPAEGRELSNWLLLTDASGVGERLAKRLTEQGHRVVVASAGSDFAVTEPGAMYQIRVDVQEDYQRLLSEVEAAFVTESQSLRGIVHLFSVDLATTNETTPDVLHEAELVGSLSVLHLTKAISGQTWRKAPSLWLATRGAQSVAGEGVQSVAQATLWGLARVIGHQEHKDIWGGIVDLDFRADEQEALALAEEIQHKDREDQIAFRNGQRYVARVQDMGDMSLPILPKLRADASYLITGGFGALGLLVARYLTERGARRLILVGREPLPPRSTWAQLEPNSRIAQRVAAVRELEALGATVHVTGFDVSDADALHHFVQEYEQEGWPAIRGIIHSAGTSTPQMLTNMSADDFRFVLKPKVQGGWNLHVEFADKPLDFFILFSSVASLIVSPGQANYSAGNEFLDALARYRQANGLPGLSINWGPWGEVGMATQLDLVEFFVKRGNHPIASEKGLEALGYAMGQKSPQVMISPIVWPVLCQNNYPLGEYPAMLDVVGTQNGTDEQANETVQEEDILERLRQTEGEAERIGLLEEHLQDVVARVLLLNRSKLTTDQPLTTLGLDSMLALELKGRLEKAYAINIAVVDLLRGPTLAELASNLIGQLPIELQAESADLLKELEGLSQEDLEKLLIEAAAAQEQAD